MAITLGDNFSYQGAKPLDGRLKYDTVAAMASMPDSVLYDGCLAYCVATDKTYQWKSSNTVDPTTSKWREFESGQTITVDSALSSTSENPVQNKVIKGALDLKADLVDGKVPAAQLPAYVDDVLEYEDAEHFPATGESGKIYIAQDTNKTYRWGGTGYVEISESLALGETSSTAYRGDRGKTAYDISQTVGDVANLNTTEKSSVVGAVNEVNGKIEYVQYSTLPTASIDNLGKIVQYIGATGGGLTNGYFYECVSDGEATPTYSWTAKNVQAGGSGGSYTAGDGIVISNDEISVDEMASADMSEVASPMPSVMSRRFKYSTQEQVVGEWIDGKPLYQKTVDFGALPNASYKSVQTGLSDCVIRNMFGVARTATGFTVTLPNAELTSSENINLSFLVTDEVRIRTGYDYSSYSAYITLQYTKTTD